MIHKLSTASIVLLSVIGFAPRASASPIVINADALTAGMDLSAVFEGLTMARLENRPNQNGINGREIYDPIASAVNAMSTYHTDAGLSIGGRSYHLESYEDCRTIVRGTSSCADYDVLELVFAEPTDFFQITSIGFSDSPGFYAYDTLGNRLGALRGGDGYLSAVASLSDSRTATTLTLARDQRDIARVVYGGVHGATTPTEVAYKVPEAETIGFMAIGLLFAVAFRSTIR